MNELPLSNFIEECLLVAENNDLADNTHPFQLTKNTALQTTNLLGGVEILYEIILFLLTNR